MAFKSRLGQTLQQLFLCCGVMAWAGLALAGPDAPTAKILCERITSNQESTRKSAIPLVEWERGHDQEYVAAIDELITESLRRPALDSHFLAVRKLADCPLPGGTETAAKALEATDWRLVMTAVEVLGHRTADSQAAAIGKLYFRPDAQRFYALRHAVVCALGDIGKPKSVEVLVNMLPALEGQLKYEALARLTRRTGKNHGDDLTAWEDWWSAQDGVVPGNVPAIDDPLPLNLPWQYPVPQFFAQPIYSQRVVFVLDRSGSMNSTLGNQTRLAAMQEEFRQAILRLPESAFFGLIVFNQKVEVWQTPLVEANIRNKTSAIQAIYRLKAEGLTAVYDALERGLQLDQNVEQIIFLTDGRPTAGKYRTTPEIVANITALNRYLHTRIDCLGIDTEGEPEELLKQIAANNFGTYTRIR